MEAEASKRLGAAHVPYTASYRTYILGVLVALYAVNFMDRQVLSILVEPIKAEFQLTDGQIGLLGGAAFALFYVSAGLPLAKLSDRFNRVNIIAICLTFWSLATAACGMAQSYLQLLLARIGVAVGEVGGTPPAYAIISDIWEPEKRPSATAIFAVGGPIGTSLGLLIAGWINEWYDWRTAFIAVGLPGILLAVLIKLTLREPARGQSENRVAVGEASTITRVARLLFSRPSFRYMAIASGMAAISVYALGLWLPSFLIRSHGMSSGEAGTWIAAIHTAGAITGSVVGGLFADKLGAGDRRWWMWVPAIALLASAPFAFLAFLTDWTWLALLCIAIPSFLMPVWPGPVYSAAQSLVGLRMRAMSVSILLFVINIIGMGAGPYLIGLMSDLFAQTAGEHSLRYSLLLLGPTILLGSTLYWAAARSLREDLKNAPP